MVVEKGMDELPILTAKNITSSNNINRKTAESTLPFHLTGFV
jgi:hypothetical protein